MSADDDRLIERPVWDSTGMERVPFDGRYRLVKIGLESVVIEHLDGRGRTTVAKGGQECSVAK